MRLSWAGCAVLALVSCTPGEDSLTRLVIHRGGSVSGPLATQLATHAKITAEGDELWAAPADAAPTPSTSWTLIAERPLGNLWRAATPILPMHVAVQPDSLPGQPLDHPILRALAVDGPVSPGGEIAARVFLKPGISMPLHTCVGLVLDGKAIALGPLLDGKPGVYPGARLRPIVRHRALAAVPPSVSVGAHTAEVVLSSCHTDTVFARVNAPLTVQPTGIPSLDDLVIVEAIADEAAKLEPPRPGRDAIFRAADGTLQTRPGPPLPRVKRSDAWGLLVVGPTDASGWPDVARNAANAPLSRLRSLFDEADATVVVLDSPAATGGDWLSTRGARRAGPHVLKQLAWLDVDAIVPGPHADDAGEIGRTETVAHAQAAGLRASTDGATMLVGDGERSVVVQIVDVARVEDIPAAVTKASAQVVLVQVRRAAQPGAAAAAIASSGAHGGWTLSDDDVPYVQIVDGVPVVHNMPGLSGKTSHAARFYVAPNGVVRVDMVGLSKTHDWDRERTDAGRAVLQQMHARSVSVGTWMAVGQTVSAVDVAAQWPLPDPPDAPAPTLPEIVKAAVPASTLPARCVAPAATSSDEIVLGDALVLESHAVTRADPTGPITVRLVWRVQGALPDGDLHMLWSVDPSRPPWRARSRPCEGSVDLASVPIGTRISDRVTLWPPADYEPGKHTLSVVARAGDTVLRTADEGRRVTLGAVP